MPAYRSLLFVPGARFDRFDKAACAGADTIIIDLEDAVLPEDKAAARTDALAWLAARPQNVSAGLRINSLRTSDGCADVAALSVSKARPDFVMVPKAETAEDIAIVSEALGGPHMIAVIESPGGVINAAAIAAQSSAGVLFGGADYSAAFGADLNDWDAMQHARGVIANACAMAGVAAYDVPFLDVKDLSGLSQTTQRAKALGFSGRACIHPAQIESVNTVFTPSAEDIREAQKIIQALADAKGGAALYKGKLVDKPIILAAERILALAAQ